MKNPLAIAAIQQQSPGIPIDLFDMISIIASDLRSAWDGFYGHSRRASCGPDQGGWPHFRCRIKTPFKGNPVQNQYNLQELAGKPVERDVV
jgi:hypothetical protein